MADIDLPPVRAGRNEVVVDATFLSTPEVNLDFTPVADSDVVTLNGLEINNTNYSIAGNVLTMSTVDLKIGDDLYIRYIGCC